MLRKARQSLRPTLRVVIQIQQLQERSTQETAEAIGISLAAAKARLFHAKVALRRSLIPKLEYQPRVASGFVLYPQGDSSRRANARTRFDDQQQSNHKEEGDEYVIENNEKRKRRAPSNLNPAGSGSGCCRELGA
jgi:hypothetical protein